MKCRLTEAVWIRVQLTEDKSKRTAGFAQGEPAENQIVASAALDQKI